MKKQTNKAPETTVPAQGGTITSLGGQVFSREAILAAAAQLQQGQPVVVETLPISGSLNGALDAVKAPKAAKKAKPAKKEAPAPKPSRFGDGKLSRTPVNYFETRERAEKIKKLAKNQGLPVSEFVHSLVSKAIGE